VRQRLQSLNPAQYEPGPRLKLSLFTY